MTLEQLQELKHVVGNMRFMQASLLVASGLNENKLAIAYMSKLARLDRLLGEEIEKETT